MLGRAHLPLLLSLLVPNWPVHAQPGKETALVSQAELALEQGDAERARRLVEEVLRREPKNGHALLLRSSIFCMEGELDRCKKDLNRALDLDPNLRQGWLNRSAIAIAERRYGDALADLQKAEALDPSAPDNALNQGAVLLLDGQIEPAARQFRRYLERLPRSAEARFLVAKNYAIAGYESLCVEHLEQAILLDERIRPRVRADVAFAPLVRSTRFLTLLETDRFAAPPGSLRKERRFRSPWKGSETLLLTATLNALQRLGWILEPQVEVASSWALIWSELRIKLAAQGESETSLELLALPGRYSSESAFEQRTEQFLSAVELELLRLERSQRPAR